MYVTDAIQMKSYLEKYPLNSDETLMIFLADESAGEYPQMITYLNSKKISFFGGIYPGLLLKKAMLPRGAILTRVHVAFRTTIGEKMDQKYEGILKNKTAFVIADGLSSHFEDMINALSEAFTDKVTYVGGGAGFYDLKHRPCVFDEHGLYKDKMIVALLDSKADVCYKHGWERLSGPYNVNRSKDNTILEINSKSAYKLYSDVIKGGVNIKLTPDHFFNLSKEHPIGIIRAGHIDVVRDLIAVNELDELVSVANVPENSSIYILKGNRDTLLHASDEVAAACGDLAHGKYQAFLFDCISRAIFLENDFSKELSNIQKHLDQPVNGVLSIGEISSMENGKIELLNKSVVLAILDSK